MSDSIRVIQYGLGPIGCATGGLTTERGNLELVGGVDVYPDKVGKDIGEVIGLARSLGLDVKEKLDQVASQADVVVHTTNSYFDVFGDQVLEILGAGLDVVSTSEELSFPWLDHVDEAAKVNAAAKRADKTVLGTGVNPGFVMDTLPLVIMRDLPIVTVF